MRGWLLRGAGLLEEAIELHGPAVEVAPGPTFQEAHYAALLDLTECHLAIGDPDAAKAAIDSAADIAGWSGSMAWRHRNRYRLLAARLAALGGNGDAGAEGARAVAADAAARGDHRYELRALLTAVTIDAQRRLPTEPAELAALIERFLPICGPDGWRDLGQLAKATGSAEAWRQAEHRAAAIVIAASKRLDLDAERVTRAVRRQLDGFQP
jgi:hypothetical protein